MVVTTRRKRSCSASEATPGTPRVAKIRKQDEDCNDSSSSSSKDAGRIETPTTTTRRTRRVTDTAITTPTTSTKVKGSNLESGTLIKSGESEESNDSVKGSEGNVTSTTTRRTRRNINTSINNTNTSVKTSDLDSQTPKKSLRRNDSLADNVDCIDKPTNTIPRRNTDTTTTTTTTTITNTKGKNTNIKLQTPIKAKRSDESTDSASENLDSSDRDEDVKERKGGIGTPTRHSSRTRTVSTGTPSVSTPVRRSRRLSGSGVDDSSSQDTPSKKSTLQTPSKKSFSIARLLSLESTPKEESNKTTVLPVIEEDVESSDTKQIEGEILSKDSTKKHGLKEFQMEYEKFTEDAKNEDCRDEVLSDVSLTDKKNKSGQSVAVKKDIKEVPFEIDEESPRKTSNKEKMETENLENITSHVTKVGSSEKDITKKVVEQNSKGDPECKTQNTKQETNNTEESTQAIQACKEIKPSHETDENGNNEKINGQNGLLASKLNDKDHLEQEKKLEHLRNIPKGLPISGRWWKKDKQRFRSINKDATGKKSWAKKMQLKQWRGEVLAKSAAIEAEKLKKKEDLKERQRINKIRREENAKKSEMVQVIKDSRKIKKMKRKQLRYLETRDTTTMK